MPARYAADGAPAFAGATIATKEQAAVLVEIGILTPDLEFHTNDDHRPEAEGARAEAG